MPHRSSTTEDDPIIASYDIYITDAQIRRFLLQYPDRSSAEPYNAAESQKPTELRLKPSTGLVEVDVPIDTSMNYNDTKGLKYGNALRKSRVVREGGAHGMAGGFGKGGAGGNNVKAEKGGGGGGLEEGIYRDEEDEDRIAGARFMNQTLGGRIIESVQGDPVYMLGAFRDNELHLSPLSAVVQVRAQLHHLDAIDENALKSKAMSKAKKDLDDDAPSGGGASSRPGPAEGRAIDMKVKQADTENVNVTGNNELLKRMQEEKWERYTWVDENDQESWDKYQEFMFNLSLEEPPQLTSAIDEDDYIDSMSAPRVDPIRPELAGLAMKMRRKKRRPSTRQREKEKEEKQGDEGEANADAVES